MKWNTLMMRDGLLTIGLVTGLMLGATNLASAQFQLPPAPPLQIDPRLLPDLVMSVTAPPGLGPTDVGPLLIRVDNLAPLIPSSFGPVGSPTSVNLEIFLTGLVPQGLLPPGVPQIPTPVGNFYCSLKNVPAQANPVELKRVSCWGSIPIGGAETIAINVQPAPFWYCARPTYSDAQVFTSSRERAKKNNRAVAVAEVVYPTPTPCQW